MRISNSPYSGIAPQPDSGDSIQHSTLGNAALNAPKMLLAQGGAANPNVQFGATGTPPQSPAQSTDTQLLSLLIQLFKGNAQTQPGTEAPGNQTLPAKTPAQGTTTPGQPSTVNDVSAATPADASKPADATQPAGAPKASEASFLDDSKYSSPKELERWAPMVANLPPDQREQAAKELNRPIAAARMAAQGGSDGAKAMDFINANPALKTAVDTGKHGGKADGKITDGDLNAFAKNMQKAADSADKDVAKYQKDHPDADPQSLELVRSAALMRANEPLTKAADPKHAQGADGKTKVDGLTSADGLKAIQDDNPGLAGALRQSAKTWSQPGFLTQIDQGGLEGRSLAAHSPDKLFSASNISDWIKKQAPTNGGEFASVLSDAATLNSVANTDISKLDKDVFDHSSAYTGEQKAAVMVKLQQTRQSVVAGHDLRKTEKTEDALNEKIGQLQADPDVQAFLDKQIPQQSRALVGSTPQLQKAVNEQMQKVNSGQALQTDMAAADKATSKDKPNADYSSAIGGLSAQLQMQKDLLGDDAKVPTADQVLGNRPDLQGQLQDSYVRNFSEGGAVKQLLNQKKADAADALNAADAQKAAYDSVLPQGFVQRQQAHYVDATLAQLQASKSGRKLLDDAQGDKDHAPSMALQVAAQMGPGALRSVAGFASVSDMLARGDKTDAAKTIYDSTKSGLSAAKQGYDAVAKSAGRAGLGEVAAKVGGRVAGMVAGEAVGMAAGAAIGASIPVVGWIADAAMSLGFGISAIIEAVKKHKAQKAFDHNVDPTLEQFGIPKAH
ncbi:type III effector HrpK domain-containing protein [Pseudomonas abietaniphila]|uniref:Type III secretion system translocator protein, HrpF n=1 Tax=Pseudomonas abietaniphila TaxID=89065 RepID=A0A1G7VYG2_9PSED|nr:type III effector HrpK domain-containing protein [Pseudomonas abietaniphila]SDG64804.1 Type III secretion system translocator protein, HrpF [Pseudomonas abietaniphila]